MAPKKCPKCGEDNPAEAVMCWACYTPLSGSAPLGAGLAAGAGVGAIPKAGMGVGAGSAVGVPPSNEEPAKKSLDPKVIGLLAFLLVGGLGAAFSNGLLGGSKAAEEAAVSDPPAADQGAGGAVAPAAPPPPIANIPQGGAAPAPVPLPFKIIATPRGGIKTGTLGILVQSGASLPGAAKFAKDQLARNGKWPNMQIAVFTDQATADAFAKFQRSRQNAPLENADFQSLGSSGLWATTPVFLDVRGRQEKIYFPSRNPLAWWPSR